MGERKNGRAGDSAGRDGLSRPELEASLARRFNELARLTRRLAASEAEQSRLRERLRDEAACRRALRDSNQRLDAIQASLAGRIGFRLMRLIMSPWTLGLGHTSLDDLDERRRQAVE